MRTVLSLSLSGSILALMLFAGKPVLKNRISKAFSYYVWLLVLLRLVVPLAAPVNIMDALFRPEQHNMSFVLPDQTNGPAVKNSVGIVGDAVTTPSTQRDSSHEQRNTGAANAQTTANARRSSLWGLIQGNFLRLWLAGAVASFGWFSVAYAAFSRHIRRSCTAPHSDDLEEFERLRGSGRVRLFCSSYVTTPILIGVLHPVIVLPQLAYIRNGMGEQFNHILRHELTHFKRKDVLYKWLVVAVTSLHWFNPFMILIRKEIGRACELSCDESLIKDMSADERQLYGNMLIALAANRKFPAGIFATTLCEDSKELKERLLSIMKYKKESVGAAVATLVLALLLTGCAATLGVANSPDAGGTAGPGSEALLAGTAYSRKMNGTIFNWHDVGCFYELDETGGINLFYGGGAATAKAPLTLSGASGLYISDKKTAIAYSDVDAPSPISILFSDDTGATWESADIEFDRTATWIKIGFTTQDDGWMVVCSFVGMGHEDHDIYMTADGGMTWNPVDSDVNDVYGRVLSGAGFVNYKTGFLCFRYETDFQPAVCVTRDGGETWSKIDISLPEEYERYSQTPLSPVYDGENVILPVLLSDEKDFTTIYLKSADYGVTWNVEAGFRAAGVGDAIVSADVDRDGSDEKFYLDTTEMGSDMDRVVLRVYNGRGYEIWNEDAYSSHSGWDSLFLCDLDGKDYLLRYNPGMWQGYCQYTYTLFTLEGGAEKVYSTATLEFDVNGTEALDPSRMIDFADEVNALLKTSTLLLSSEGGTFKLGPAPSDAFLETYSWLDEYPYPEIYEDGDDLATRLQKYSDYAVSNRARVN